MMLQFVPFNYICLEEELHLATATNCPLIILIYSHADVVFVMQIPVAIKTKLYLRVFFIYLLPMHLIVSY